MLYGIAAYVLWGVLPLYFVALSSVNPFELVAWRIFLTVLFCAVLITVMRQWSVTLAVFRNRRAVIVMTVAGLFVYVNWQTFVIAAVSGRVLDASLGYFINPVVTVLLARFVLKEPLRPVQWIAIATTIAAFIVISIGYGIFPWIAMTLAISFGLYGFLKKQLGASVGAIPGQFIEAVALSPIAAVILAVVAFTTGLTAFTVSPGTQVLLSLLGPVTAVPLMLFAAATSRLPLRIVGFIQYLAPSLMFLLGWLVLGEETPPARWIGFGMVWASLVLLSFDSWKRFRGSRAVKVG